MKFKSRRSRFGATDSRTKKYWDAPSSLQCSMLKSKNAACSVNRWAPLSDGRPARSCHSTAPAWGHSTDDSLFARVEPSGCRGDVSESYHGPVGRHRQSLHQRTLNVQRNVRNLE